MAEILTRRIFLRRRYGISGMPFLIFNGIIIFLLILRIDRFGINSVGGLGFGAFIAFLFLNIIPLYALYDIWSYRIGYNDSSIFVRPLVDFGPYLEMHFDDIDIVDLKALSDLGNIANARLNPSVIVLYRKGWDGDEIFALDPRRTNLKQFKELVQRIYERQPDTFTENALRYLYNPELR